MQYQMRCLLDTVLLGIVCFIFIDTSWTQATSVPIEIEKELVSLFKLVNDYSKLPSDSSCITGSSYTFEEKISKALQYNRSGNWKCCEKLLLSDPGSEKILNSKDSVQLHTALAEYFNSHHLYDSSIVLALKANIGAKRKDMVREEIRALLVIANSSLQLRKIYEAYKYADSALQISRHYNDKLMEGKSLMQMGLCARRHFTALANRTLPYYMDAKKISEINNDSLILFSSNMLIADDYFQNHKLQEGLPYLRTAIQIALKSGNVQQKYSVYIILSMLLVQSEHYDESFILLKNALALTKKQKLPYSLQHTYLRISDHFHLKKQFDSSLYYANLSASVQGVDSSWANMWIVKANIYKDLGDFKSASEMYERGLDMATKDFLYRNQEQLSGYEATLKTKEKELQIEVEMKKRSKILWTLWGILILFLVVLYAFTIQRRARRLLTAQNIMIESQKQQLEKSLDEKNILIKEIHHRVKNNLEVISSLLELQSNSSNDLKAKSALEAGQIRVQSIALIHHKLYHSESLAKIAFKEFIEDLYSQICKVFLREDANIMFKVSGDDLILEMDVAVPIGLILNELMTNSFKYAVKKGAHNTISIQLVPIPDQSSWYKLVYKDNGPGLPVGLNIAKSTSLGMKVILLLTKQLGGKLNYYFDHGSVFEIPFSIYKNNLKK